VGTIPNYFVTPAQHLNNVFVNMEILEASNKPKNIKHKRRKITKAVESDSKSASSEESSCLSSDDNEDNKHKEIKNNNDSTEKLELRKSNVKKKLLKRKKIT
jgi:hypothetical protein